MNSELEYEKAFEMFMELRGNIHLPIELIDFAIKKEKELKSKGDGAIRSVNAGSTVVLYQLAAAFFTYRPDVCYIIKFIVFCRLVIPL